MSQVTYCMSQVTCHMSLITNVTRHLSCFLNIFLYKYVILFVQICESSQWRVCHQQSLPSLVFQEADTCFGGLEKRLIPSISPTQKVAATKDGRYKRWLLQKLVHQC